MRGTGLTLVLVLVSACGPQGPVSGNDGSNIPTYQAPQVSYCSTVTNYGGATVTISGDAKYYRREPFGDQNGGGLGAPGAARPIRRAEVRVTNAAGSVVQCTETLANGSYSFVLPQSATGVYTVAVTSRASNDYLKAYVYDDPRLNNYYSITTTFTPSNSQVLSTLTALATGDVKGGAFNILDQFYEANEFLRNHVGNCGFAPCSGDAFTVAPKVTAYWKPGFNPAEYYGETSGLSFYLPGYDRLFILGGVDGDFDNEDTDHFDNSVILHEFGHFLEDNHFISDSPGGQHSGNKIIDPRLAWSEGWGNFFQGAVRNDPTYIDTEGNSSGSTALLFYVNLEDQTRDIPVTEGEGHFREFSVTRNFWDAWDNAGPENTNGGSDTLNTKFGEIWHGLTSLSGFLKPSAAFHQVGHFHEFHQTTMVPQGAVSWNGIRTLERHVASTDDYAQYVTTTGSCSYTLTPSPLTSDGAADNGTFARSHLLLNNDFYHLRLTGSQSVTVVLEYIDADGFGTKADMDLYLYREAARYGTISDMADYSEATPAGGVVTAETETVGPVSLGAGNYLINVKAFTGGALGGAVYYTLKLNGSPLCPANLP